VFVLTLKHVSIYEIKEDRVQKIAEVVPFTRMTYLNKLSLSRIWIDVEGVGTYTVYCATQVSKVFKFRLKIYIN